jgi:hypothetical protein
MLLFEEAFVYIYTVSPLELTYVRSCGSQIYSVMTLVGSSAMAKAVPEFNTAVRFFLSQDLTTLVVLIGKCVDRWGREVC